MNKPFYSSVCLMFLLLGISLTSSAQIVFSPGSGASSPAPTLGPYTMTPVVDTQPNNSSQSTSFVNSPLSGSITFSPSVRVGTPQPAPDANLPFTGAILLIFQLHHPLVVGQLLVSLGFIRAILSLVYLRPDRSQPAMRLCVELTPFA